MNKFFVSTAALFGALSVALGAFAAHKLRMMLPADAVAVFETGVRYQFYHALALLMIGIAAEKFSPKWIRWAGNCFIVGIILFSCSLYGLTILKITEITSLNSFVGIITPFGGLFFIAGWLFLFFAASKK
ncbi:MAG TPA: DUF423 domain-containing protein [Puia sp.]|nr:DUF423 domain-containing protein [Puia sp.]